MSSPGRFSRAAPKRAKGKCPCLAPVSLLTGSISILSSAQRHENECCVRPGWTEPASERGNAPFPAWMRTSSFFLPLFFLRVVADSRAPLDFPLPPPLSHLQSKNQVSTSAGAMTAPPRALSSSRPLPPARPAAGTSPRSPRGSSRASSRASARTSSRRRATSLPRRTLCTRPF